MYVCDSCAKEYDVEVVPSLIGVSGCCELHGHLKGRWGRSVQWWCRYVRRPIGERDPKKYILDQIAAEREKRER